MQKQLHQIKNYELTHFAKASRVGKIKNERSLRPAELVFGINIYSEYRAVPAELVLLDSNIHNF